MKEIHEMEAGLRDWLLQSSKEEKGFSLLYLNNLESYISILEKSGRTKWNIEMAIEPLLHSIISNDFYTKKMILESKRIRRLVFFALRCLN